MANTLIHTTNHTFLIYTSNIDYNCITKYIELRTSNTHTPTATTLQYNYNSLILLNLYKQFIKQYSQHT